MDGLLVDNGTAHERGPVKRYAFLGGQRSKRADVAPAPKLAVFNNDDVHELRIADAGSALGDCREHRLDIARRVRDHPEDVADRGLLLQRLGQLIGAPMQFVEQARILDRDRGLVGERLQKRNVPLFEGTYLGEADQHRTEGATFVQKRHAQRRAMAILECDLAAGSKFISGVMQVRHMHRFPVDDGTAHDGGAVDRISIPE